VIVNVHVPATAAAAAPAGGVAAGAVGGTAPGFWHGQPSRRAARGRGVKIGRRAAPGASVEPEVQVRPRHGGGEPTSTSLVDAAGARAHPRAGHSPAARRAGQGLLVVAAACAILFGSGPALAATLANDQIRVELGARGPTALADTSTGAVWRIVRDEFGLTLDGTTYDSAALPAPVRTLAPGSATYRWRAGAFEIDVVYELPPGWRFLGKRIVVSGPAEAYRVDRVTVFRTTLGEAPADSYVHAPGRADLGVRDYALALRFSGRAGLLALAQNPFLETTRDGATFTVGYAPDLEWRREYGPFVADRGLLVPAHLTGRRLPARMRPEWLMADEAAGPGLDEGEVAAFTEAVRALLLYRPAEPVAIFVGWCANDYQIDVATEAGRAEYVRLLDRAAALGMRHVLFAPTNSALARREDSIDDWSWENLLWLGLGQRLRRGEWDPATSPIPDSVQTMLEEARARGLSLVAYVYPVVAFSQDPSWLVTRRGDPGGRRYASLGVRRLQDWLIETLIAFRQRTGIGGYAFDHTFLTFDGPSTYAQWWGWRRVMETLRARMPDIVIDGRQAYHLYGPWSWLAGSYPHPTYHDEQPESFVPFPDLSFDRVSAARQRYTAWRYRNVDFAPSEIVPGFITHQTPRLDATGRMPEIRTDKGILLTRFRARDWDYLGWRYSLLSSIATGGWNHVLNMIPARDPEEHEHFSEADQAWFRRWIEWARTNRELLRHTRTILGEPALGRIDGTAAIREDRGYLFLFNPNARRLSAEVPLDESIGLTRGGHYLIEELHPVEGRAVGKPGAGIWSRGDRLAIEMDGQSALVLAITPAPPAALASPRLFNAPGRAALAGGVLRLEGVTGEPGTAVDLLVRVPEGEAVSRVAVNGRDLPFEAGPRGLVTVPVRFEGERFGRAEPVGSYDPAFAGGPFAATFRVPRRVVDQLAARARTWPIRWTPDDYHTPWLAPHRLLLFVQIAEPDDRWAPALRIDGRPVALEKAYTALRPVARTFVGFYADVSLLAPDRDYRLELDLPPLRPGQFQGVFFQNVEPDYTAEVAPRP